MALNLHEPLRTSLPDASLSLHTDTSQQTLNYLEQLPDQYAQLFPPGANGFSSFSELPTELRLRVWTISFPKARKLPIFINNKSGDYLDESVISAGCQYRNPITLWINKESRAETLCQYWKLMGGGPVAQIIYFNPETDIISIREAFVELRDSHLQKIFPTGQQTIRHLELRRIHACQYFLGIESQANYSTLLETVLKNFWFSLSSLTLILHKRHSRLYPTFNFDDPVTIEELRQMAITLVRSGNEEKCNTPKVIIQTFDGGIL
ncbi:hypothetical protein B0J14DRAFT_569422 [Halenospora varia]|nr:hypothetical protein B0J14DRAFT_569422 [Halenospora varia]